MILSKGIIAFYLKELGFEIDKIKIHNLLNTKNFCFKVSVLDGNGYFLKQSKSNKKSFLDDIKQEALFYKEIEKNENFKELKEIIPTLVSFDNNNSVIITELVCNSTSLDNFLKKQVIDLKVIKMLGNIFSILSKIEPSKINNFSITRTLLIFNLENHDDFLFNGVENLPLKGVVNQIKQNKILLRGLKKTGEYWEINGVLNGDIKFNNFLIIKKTGQIVIVDWEGVSIGDKDWDLACMIQCFIFEAIFKAKINLSTNYSILNDGKLIFHIQQFVLYSGISLNNNKKQKICLFIASAILQKIIETHQTENTFGLINNILLKLVEDIYKKPNKYFFIF